MYSSVKYVTKYARFWKFLFLIYIQNGFDLEIDLFSTHIYVYIYIYMGVLKTPNFYYKFLDPSQSQKISNWLSNLMLCCSNYSVCFASPSAHQLGTPLKDKLKSIWIKLNFCIYILYMQTFLHLRNESILKSTHFETFSPADLICAVAPPHLVNVIAVPQVKI